MQRAQLDSDDQNSRSRGRANNMMGEPQRIYRRIASHEADDGPFNRWTDARRLDDALIEAGRHEASA
jgi:hypothetical protein